MKTAAFQAVIKALDLDEADGLQRLHLFELLKSFNEQIAQLEEWLKKKAEVDNKVQLLETQRGVGYLTALATLHTLGDVSRFPRIAKQVASFAGFDPLEKSSAAKTRFGRISKAGSPLFRFGRTVGNARLATRSE